MTIPPEVKRSLSHTVKFRSNEIELLSSFISLNASNSSSALIIHGYKSVGKTFTVENYLTYLGVRNSIIRCDECVTNRVLLQRCFNKIKSDSGKNNNNNNDQIDKLKFGKSLESFYNFANALEKFIENSNYTDHHVLVLDRFDQCMESTNDLFIAFLRLREISKLDNLSIIFIISTDIPKEIVTSTIPTIYFKPYTEIQITEILQSSQSCLFGIEEIDNNPSSYEFWKQYAKIVVDLFFSYTGSDLNLLMDIIIKIWDKFIEPVIEGKYNVNEFVKVYRQGSELFTNENVINNSLIREYSTLQEEKPTTNGNVEDLPIHSKFILIASYLASFVEQKDDLHKFSKVKAVKYKKRVFSHKPNTKNDIDSRLLSPGFFDLERMFAILSVIYRNTAPSLNQQTEINLENDVAQIEEKKDIERAKFTLSRNTDLYSQVATLFSLGLISKSAASDILGARVRWKCNISWQTAEALCKEVDFPILDYLADEP
ncbi:origin recognition complex subunit 5 C-terminus-domain-containing protein [Scheffersomyces amazonensis]|uniref:origin recognition complex subunit 5 C-terminus-domain-containing protein n=1 Tax=Scheffersomyces amazonensis TaxID=1078765 RepID=UPI00315C9D56